MSFNNVAAISLVSSITATVRHQLRMHLYYAQHQENTDILNIGTEEQLKAAAKISASEEVSKCFDWLDGTPKAFPSLPKGCSLVACVNRWTDTDDVVAVYNFAQMEQMQALRGTSEVQFIKWCVLEIPEELKSSLLKYVSLKDGHIISSYPSGKVSDKT